MKKVAIIVPVYNRRELLGETIQSVLAQTYSDWELLLVDDGSTDGSDTICRDFSLKDARIRYIQRTGEKKGGSVCRNIGIKNAKAEYLLFLDSDDLLAPYCLDQRIHLMEKNPGLDFYVFPMLLFREKTDDMMVLQNIPTQEDALMRFLLRENVWLMSCPLWNAKAIHSLGGFNETYLSYQDWELNVRALVMGLQYRFFSEARPDNFYRQHEQTVSGSRFNQPNNVSNAQMLIDIAALMREKKLLNETKRCALAGFLVDVIKRAKLLPMPVKEIRTFAREYAAKAVIAGLLTQEEEKTLNSYMKWHTTKMAYRFHWFKNRVENHFRKKKLAHLFPIHVTNQLKHLYTGSLA